MAAPPLDPTSVDFPADWAGPWVDGAGKVLEVRCVGRLLFVSVRAPGSGAFYPLPGLQGRFSEDLSARFFTRVGGCWVLEVELGEGLAGPLLQLEFWVAEGEGLRLADLEDAGELIRLRPVLVAGFGEEGEPLVASWVYPLLFFSEA